MAAIDPSEFSAAYCICSERTFTSSIPSSNVSTSEATKAEYSPRLCPATTSGLKPLSLSSSKIAIEWYQNKFQQTLVELEDHYSKYRLSDALMSTYKLIWNDFCSWLLEMVKPAYQHAIDKTTYDAVIVLLEDNLKILHPFMPFLTEEIL